jgi:hypothetical protein
MILGKIAWKPIQSTNEFLVTLVESRAFLLAAAVRRGDRRHLDLRAFGDIHAAWKNHRSLAIFASVRHKNILTASAPSFKRSY